MNRINTKNLLIEIGCAELPAKNLWGLITQLAEKLSIEIKEARLDFGAIQVFATPRRLALLVKNLETVQPGKQVEKRGPAVGAPEKAKQGFAVSCGTSMENLVEKQGYYYYLCEEPAEKTKNLLPDMLKRALLQLKDIKTMRWGNHTAQFLRPVYWAVLLYGEEKIDAQILGVNSHNITYGHRFHSPKKIVLLNAENYEDTLLEEGFVRADFEKRREFIRREILQAAQAQNAKVIIDDNLLNEVTGLVEWPVILRCEFPGHFLQIPKEVLISSMQHHQKSFPVYSDSSGQTLLPWFITVSNIQSLDPAAVIQGNERVMKARLSDALFFYEQDKKILLGLYLKKLEKIIFQEKLGSVADKVKRIVILSEKIAGKIHADKANTKRAAILCKADLATQMVGEFPELQGMMGGHYARIQGESEEIAQGIEEHYLPRFAGDKLPKSAIGCAVALADRFDSLNAIFSINQIPTGDKDPFGLRRAAMGIIRMIIEKSLAEINLSDFCETPEVQKFILDRLPAYYQENNISLDILQAVLEVEQNNLYQIDLRMAALKSFLALPEAGALTQANKRVKNILKKNRLNNNIDINKNLFEYDIEKILYQKIIDFKDVKDIKDVKKLLAQLAGFKELIDEFFTQVMVETEDLAVRQNRLKLLELLRGLFLQAADISLLQS